MRMAADIARLARTTFIWLRADARQVVGAVPRDRVGDEPLRAAPALRPALTRWSHRLSRRRAGVIAERYLVVAAAIVVIAEIAAVVASGHRPPWLLAPLALVPAAAAATLARGITLTDTARVLDGDLGLHDQLGTALELTDDTGLAGLVHADADAALRRSVGGARAVARGSRHDNAIALASAAAVALAIFVPASGHSPVRPRTEAIARGGAGHPAAGQGLAPGQLPPPSRAGQTHAPTSRAPAGSGVGYGRALSSRLGAATGDPVYGGAFSMTAAQVRQLLRQGLGRTTAGAGTLGLHGGPVPGSQSGSGSAAAGGAPGGAGGGLGSLGGLNGAAASPGAAPSLQSASSGGARGTTQSQSGASAAAGRGGAGRSSGGASGGETAGTALGGANLGSGLIPLLKGGAALPLQAGYAPTAAGRSRPGAGASQIANGGGGSSLPVAGGGASSGGAGANFPPIPPTFNTVASTIQSLLEGYFGVADQLTFRGW